MTYKELLNRLNQLPTERLDDTVTVYCQYMDEYTEIIGADVSDEADTNVLDHNHFYLILA